MVTLTLDAAAEAAEGVECVPEEDGLDGLPHDLDVGGVGGLRDVDVDLALPLLPRLQELLLEELDARLVVLPACTTQQLSL